MKNDFATLEEIKYAETLLLPQGKSFETDKLKIIQCNESKPIKACPGSGKTTTLLAKLAILANRMPLDNNQGICVLTHTNVAINEIKSKLGHKSDILFSYPNHFGTIQSFVDKFLAIPWYLFVNKKRLNDISNDAYYKAFDRSFRSRIYQLNKNELANHIWYLIKNNIRDGQDNNYFLYSLRLDLIDYNYEIVTLNGDVLKFNKPKHKNQKNYINWSDKERDEIKQWFVDTILNVHSFYGAINYFDAYVYAKDYLNCALFLSDSFSSRFKYVFIDEMQDSDAHQLQIIEKIFNKEKTVIQYFGDPHQAIFNKAKAEGIWNPDKPLPINSSKRFGENIAKVLRSVCIEPNPDLVANEEIISLKPQLIIYDDAKKVLPKYCELITTIEIDIIGGERKTAWELALEENKPVKAVGWVGEPNKEDKDVNQMTIQSYFRSFRKNIKKKEILNYDSLKSFLKKQENATVKDYSDNIIKALIHILSTENIKPKTGAKNRNYTKTTLLGELKDLKPEMFSNLNKNLAIWSFKLHFSEGYDSEVTTTVKAYIKNTFLKYFGISTPNKYTTDFLESEPSSEISAEQLKANNIFTWENDDSVQIELGTIHSVKGETHISTLLLETWYEGKHESEIIMDQLLGIPYKTKAKDTYRKETLKMAYVAMSRPKYLLCMAIKKDRIQAILDDPVKKGYLVKIWEVVVV